MGGTLIKPHTLDNDQAGCSPPPHRVPSPPSLACTQVGVDIPDSAVFPEFNKLNPDYGKAEFKAPLGRYTKGCGLKNLQFAFGHDEYMYQVSVTAVEFPEPLPINVVLTGVYCTPPCTDVAAQQDFASKGGAGHCSVPLVLPNAHP